MPLGTDRIECLYTEARAHGLGHEDALRAVAAGGVKCWCGKEPACLGGARKLIGCAVFVHTPYLEFEHTRHKGDLL